MTHLRFPPCEICAQSESTTSCGVHNRYLSDVLVDITGYDNFAAAAQALHVLFPGQGTATHWGKVLKSTPFPWKWRMEAGRYYEEREYFSLGTLRVSAVAATDIVLVEAPSSSVPTLEEFKDILRDQGPDAAYNAMVVMYKGYPS